MSEFVSRQIKLAARPLGLPKSGDWELAQVSLPLPGNEQVIVKVHYVSVDPAMRGWMNSGRNYVPGVELGEVMRAVGGGRVVASGDPAYEVGDYVTGMVNVQEYALVSTTADGVMPLRKVDLALAPLATHLSTLGMTGLTAYFGLLNVACVKSGDCVVISGAAGAVGSAAGQIAKIKDAYVVGIDTGEERLRYLIDDLGFDSAIDYATQDIRRALRAACPNGIDIYFDNVGGDSLDSALSCLALHARVVICGALSQYNSTTPIQGPNKYMALLVQRARMEGLLVSDYAEHFDAAVRDMVQWIDAGLLKSKAEVIEGLDNFPRALEQLFTGHGPGKLLLRVCDDD